MLKRIRAHAFRRAPSGIRGVGGGVRSSDAGTEPTEPEPPTEPTGGGPEAGAPSTPAAPDAGAIDAAVASDPYAAARELCVSTTNEYRASIGVAALSRWTAAEACVDGQAKTDFESEPHTSFGSCTERAQNECSGSGALEPLVRACLAGMWAEGPGGGHYENMVSTKRTRVACGFYPRPNGGFFVTQDFQ